MVVNTSAPTMSSFLVPKSVKVSAERKWFQYVNKPTKRHNRFFFETELLHCVNSDILILFSVTMSTYLCLNMCVNLHDSINHVPYVYRTISNSIHIAI